MTLKQVLRWQVACVCLLMGSLTAQAQSGKPNILVIMPDDDGSYTIHFGGEPGSVNHLPIAEGWNYMVRFYQPRKEILDGTWEFPQVKPVASK